MTKKKEKRTGLFVSSAVENNQSQRAETQSRNPIVREISAASRAAREWATWAGEIKRVGQGGVERGNNGER